MKPTELTPDLLRTVPLPQPEAGSKEGRGRVLVIAGSVEVPGAAVLTATAALRAGAGKLQVATVKSAAMHVAMTIPEAMVIGLAETSDGGVDHHAAKERMSAQAKKVDAVVIGPGMTEGEPTTALAATLCADSSSASFVLDAAALCDLRPHAEAIRSLKGRVVITPHAGEMAQFLDKDRDEIEADPLGAAEAAADLLNAVVVMKGSQSHIVSPGGRSWLFKGGGVGLATSGSGDVLAGLIAGLLARGAEPVHAALWGVYLHGEAGRILGGKTGPLGFLARDLAAEVPAIMRDVAR
jgi:ADP-dependent NAD(P)H-hydrate dehydratase